MNAVKEPSALPYHEIETQSNQTVVKAAPRINVQKAVRLFRDNKRMILAVIGALAVLRVALFFFGQDKPEADLTGLAPDVDIIVMQPETLINKINTPGTVSFFEKAAVAAKIQGRIESLFVEIGDRVEKGQELAQLETFELELSRRGARAQLNSSRSGLALADAQYRRARQGIQKQIKGFEQMQTDILNKKADWLAAKETLRNKKEIYDLGGVSRQELKAVYNSYLSSMTSYYNSRKSFQTSMIGYRNKDLLEAGLSVPRGKQESIKAFIDYNTEVEREQVNSARMALENAKLSIDNVDLQIRESTLRSPLAGIVASRAIEIGEETKANEPVFTVIRQDKLLITTSVSEEEISNVEQGMTVEFTVDATGGDVFSGIVYRVSPVIDTKTRTAEVRIEYDNSDERLNPGMFVRTSIITRKKENSFALPESALGNQRKEKGQIVADVYVLKNDNVFKRQVALGERFGDRFEVIGGLAQGEGVAISNINILKDGAQIRPRDKTPEKKKDSGSQQPSATDTPEAAAPANGEEPRNETDPTGNENQPAAAPAAVPDAAPEPTTSEEPAASIEGDDSPPPLDDPF